MADVNVKFIHPTDGRQVTVTMDDTMIVEEAIGELLENYWRTTLLPLIHRGDIIWQ